MVASGDGGGVHGVKVGVVTLVVSVAVTTLRVMDGDGYFSRGKGEN